MCGCGWTNGANLSVCAQCGRTPTDGLALSYESAAYRAHQRSDKTVAALQQVEQERDAARDMVRHEAGCHADWMKLAQIVKNLWTVDVRKYPERYVDSVIALSKLLASLPAPEPKEDL